jgi:class 3 adenylate cyclase
LLLKNRLEIKILLLLIVVLIAGFGTYVILSINSQSTMLIEQNRQKSMLFGQTIMVGIRNVMLSGKASYARTFVNDARDSLASGMLNVYDREANEVFQEEGKGLIKSTGDPDVRRVIESQREVEKMMSGESETGIFTRLEPLFNEKECQQCHGTNHTVRGVTWVSLKPDLMALDAHGSPVELSRIQSEVSEIVCNTLAASFRNIMVSGEGPLMDTLINRTSALPFIERVQVYDRFGDLHFGFEKNVRKPDEVLRAISKAEPIEIVEKRSGFLTRLIPLRNEERCQVCHDPKNPWRGIMAITLRLDHLEQNPDSLKKQLTMMLQSSVGAGFRSIMLVGKGSYVRSFINEVRLIPAVRDLRVFDREGNERFVNRPVEELGKSLARQALESKEIIESTQMINGEEYLVRVSPLINDKRCQGCHGTDHTVRGVVEVAASMADINAAISKNKIYSLVTGALTILLVWLVLRLFMKHVVVHPIGNIGDVAQRVGRGDFSATAVVQSKDEIGDLANRINEMIVGLRERFHLQKFVSQQTVDAVRQADSMGVKLGGERKTATVFFSDVRGFTSFSEKVEPERVVAMLNSILSRQTDIVKKYGGDIDKFVGDELVAVFLGEEMVKRAVECALEIQQTMNDVSATAGEDVGIGIGINTGEMVMGAMGSEDRMDFTVIGDSVNLGARLCSAAKRGQILLSGNSAEHLAGANSIHLMKLDPIRVKGKEQPIEIFEVRAHA